MKHKFRKYISKRGSALFMVLSVMTSLIVTCMAMYFSVVSSRKTQYAIFNQQQSYQSALSLNESLLGAIYSKLEGTNGSGFSELAKAMFNLGVGEKLTTSGNGFSSFGAGTKEDESQVGAYTAEITMLGSVAEGNLYDIAVTAMINGTQTIVRQTVVLGSGVTAAPVNPGTKLPLFTASGLVPTNSSIGMGAMYADVFYDSEFADLMPYGNQHGTNAQMKILGNLYAAGSLSVNCRISSTYQKDEFAIKPHKWYIRKDLIMSNEGGAGVFSIKFPLESEIDNSYTDKTNRIIVGRNCTFKSDAQGFANCDLYILGDLIIEPGAKIGENVRIFVAGSVTGSTSGTNIDVYQGEGNWNSAGGVIFSKSECLSEIASTTGDVKYYDWNSAYGVIDEYGNKKDIPSLGSGDLGLSWNYEYPITWNDSKAVKDANGNKYLSYTINSIAFTSGKYGDYDNGDGFKVTIDTGDDPNNVFVIKLNGYLDGNTVFSWSPNYGDWPVWVITKGKGTVVFEVPDKVTYENRSYKTTVMHEGWLDPFQSHNIRGQVGQTMMKSKFIHHGCGDTCCVNELKLISGKTCTKEDAQGNVCGEPLYRLYCPTHSLDKEVCKKCDANEFTWREEGGKEVSYGTCEYRVNLKNSGITPNVNIYLVMCGSESRLKFTPDKNKCDVNGINESLSSFWGFIYAPYATLEYSAGLSGGDRIAVVGGIAVAEFNVNEYHPYVAAYPNRTPDELMPSTCGKHELLSIDGKPWKEAISTGPSA